VCIETDAVCADESRVNYVGGLGASDAGTCSKSAPCATLAYAFGHIHPPKDIIHVGVGTASSSSPIDVPGALILDGTGTSLSLQGSPAFTFSTGGNLTIENVTLAVGVGGLVVPASGGIRMFASKLTLGGLAAVHVTGGVFTLAATDVAASSQSSIECDSGQLTLDRATITDLKVEAADCTVRVRRSKLQDAGIPILQVNNGLAEIENNLFVQTLEYADSIQIGNSPNSSFNFNTVVCTSTIQSDGVALNGDSTLTGTSNIFAYNSSNPIQGTPTLSHSLFDTPGAADAGANTVADAATIFVNLMGGDFHLSATSPAIGKGEAGVVSIDIDGDQRSTSMPDIGAYEHH
jgi:hypothetical protein